MFATMARWIHPAPRRGQPASAPAGAPEADAGLPPLAGVDTAAGLTIAQNFIQHHHGTIDCASRPGSTVFTLRLPIEQA